MSDSIFESVMREVMDRYSFLIKEDSDGKKYVFSDIIDSLELSLNDKICIRLTFTTQGIEIIERKKEEIKQEDRSDKVKDYNYGEIQSNSLESFDKPVLAKIVYEGDNIIFEDYEELDNFIIYEFIPDNVLMKRSKSRNTKSLDLDKPYPSIRLSDIVKLRLSEKEVEHVIDVLLKEGIRIGGTSQDLDSEFVNYDYIRTYVTKKYAKPLSKREQHDKFMEFRRTRDPIIREELITRNLRLVPYITWKLSLYHGIDQEELESSGYEGLILAVDNYDPLSNYSFSTYAINHIKWCIHKYVLNEKGFKNKGELYVALKSTCYMIEREWGKKFDGDPEMIEEIVDTMADQSDTSYSEEKRKRIKRMLYEMSNTLSYEQIKEGEALNGSIEDVVDTDLADAITVISKNMMVEQLKKALKALTLKEKKILDMRFGFTDGRVHTLEEVAREYSINENHVRQIELKALGKLRRSCRREKNYLDEEFPEYSSEIRGGTKIS